MGNILRKLLRAIRDRIAHLESGIAMLDELDRSYKGHLFRHR